MRPKELRAFPSLTFPSPPLRCWRGPARAGRRAAEAASRSRGPACWSEGLEVPWGTAAAVVWCVVCGGSRIPACGSPWHCAVPGDAERVPEPRCWGRGRSVRCSQEAPTRCSQFARETGFPLSPCWGWEWEAGAVGTRVRHVLSCALSGWTPTSSVGPLLLLELLLPRVISLRVSKHFHRPCFVLAEIKKDFFTSPVLPTLSASEITELCCHLIGAVCSRGQIPGLL